MEGAVVWVGEAEGPGAEGAVEDEVAGPCLSVDRLRRPQLRFRFRSRFTKELDVVVVGGAEEDELWLMGSA